MLNMVIGLVGPAATFPWITVFVVFAGAWSLATIAASLMQFGQSPQVQRYSNVLAWCTALLVLGLFAIWAFTAVHNNPAYGTDELAFDQYAAQLLVHHGLNPYAHSMAPAFQQFRVSPDGATYTLTGQSVTAFSYPSLAFLVYVPFLLLGWSSELGVGLNIIAWGVSVLLMFKLFPRNMRALALVIGLLDSYIATAVGGVTDVLYMPLLIITAYRWDRFGKGWRTYLGPVALGLAMAIKQTPWPLLAFVLLAIAGDEYLRSGMRAALHRARRYLGVVLAAFLVPNLPFLLIDPASWIHGTLTPLVKSMVPSGQGTIALSLFLHLGGGSLFAYSLSMVLVGLLALVAYLGTYPLMRPATFMVPALIFFFAERSQTNYLTALVPVAIIGAVTIGPAPRPRRQAIDGGLLEAGLTGHGWRAWLARQIGPTGPVRSLRWAQVIAVAALLAVVSTAHAVTAAPPLGITITSVNVDGIHGIAQLVKVRVQNTTSQPATPHFTIEDRSGFTAFLIRLKGPRTLAPHHTAKYLLAPNNTGAMPSLGGGFNVVAFLTNPNSVSISNHYLPQLMHLVFQPQAEYRPIPIGKVFTVRVALVGHLNQAAHLGGVAVSMYQTINGGFGHGSPSAIIDGHLPGSGNVIGYTNSQGVATFRIVGTHAGLVPTEFQASLADTHVKFMYGITGQLAVRFVGSKAFPRSN